MSAWLGSLALVAMAWLLFAAATSVAVSVLWRASAARRRRAHPAARARVALLFGAAPTLLPTILLAVCLAPGIAAWLGLHPDHCLAHRDHPHVCLVHPMAALGAPSPALAGIGLLAVGLALAVPWRVLRGFGAAGRHLSALRVGTARELAPGVRLVGSARPFSLTAGLARPGIWLSTALADSLSSDALEVVIEHERAHARRRDPARSLLADALSLPLPPGVRREVLAELSLATERACDEEAGRRLGDRLRVAEAIVAAERRIGGGAAAPSPAHAAIGGSVVALRVRGLLDADPGPAPAGRRLVAVVALSLALPLLGSGTLHHVTEHLLRLLLGAG